MNKQLFGTCVESAETINHLFIECPYSASIRESIAKKKKSCLAFKRAQICRNIYPGLWKAAKGPPRVTKPWLFYVSQRFAGTYGENATPASSATELAQLIQFVNPFSIRNEGKLLKPGCFWKPLCKMGFGTKIYNPENHQFQREQQLKLESANHH